MAANRTTPINLWGDYPAQLDYYTLAKPDGECWPFSGFINPSTGYGQVGRNIPAHRVAWEVAHGHPIPGGLVVDHTCHNGDPTCRDDADCPHRRCVNPEHLEAVTFAENVRRGRGFSGVNAARTECPKGHPYDEVNTYLYRGKRQCAACRKASNDVSNAKARARRAADRGAARGHSAG